MADNTLLMEPLDFALAREIVLGQTRELRPDPRVEVVPLDQSPGRVLAEPVAADRDYPPFRRAARDGFAVRSEDVEAAPARLRVIGETRAGEPARHAVGPGEAVEIMTGAPSPDGADCIVMVEYSSRDGDDVTLTQGVAAGRNIVPRGSEARADAELLPAGTRLGYGHVGVMATVGRAEVKVYRKPTVSIISTGDEIIPIDQQPLPHQIRNSNAHSLATQVHRAGGIPRILPIARDELADTQAQIEAGLDADLLVLSGGVSMGKHDLVETVLATLGAEFFVTAVKIQPGKPFVFGRVGNTPVCGLPGNPISTMVTFELFARAVIDLLSGSEPSELPYVQAPLATAFSHKPVLTRFLPARYVGRYGAARIDPIQWQGSGDLAAFSRAQCFLVATPDRERWEQGDLIESLPL